MCRLGKSLIALAAVFIYGTAGSSDLNTISFRQTLAQCVVGLIVIGIGCGIIDVANRRN